MQASMRGTGLETGQKTRGVQRIRMLLRLFIGDGWRVSNDVGAVKTHVLRSGRRSRLS